MTNTNYTTFDNAEQNNAKESKTMETKQEQIDRKNFETCKRIGDEVEKIAAGSVYACPECGERIDTDGLEMDDDGYVICPECGKRIDLDNAEQYGLYDYFSDALDIEYRIGSDKQYRSACIMVACGGPNIYVDTGSKRVELYWWSDRASYRLASDSVDAIDEVFEEYYDCM